MKHEPKIGAFITALGSHSARGGLGLTHIFREGRRRLRRFVVYVELAELTLGAKLNVAVELLDEQNDLVWDAMEVSETNRLRTGAWLFHLDGPGLSAGSYALHLYVNGTIADVRNLLLE
jgi:hypothetical protein